MSNTFRPHLSDKTLAEMACGRKAIGGEGIVQITEFGRATEWLREKYPGLEPKVTIILSDEPERLWETLIVVVNKRTKQQIELIEKAHEFPTDTLIAQLRLLSA